MIVSKAEILAALESMPDVLEMPDEWPTPSGVPGAYARVMSFDVMNPKGQNQTINTNFEKCDSDGTVHMPQWAVTAQKDALMADPATMPYAVMALAGLTGLAWIGWSRKIAPADEA